MTKTFKYKFDDLFNPLLKALHNLGGSATIAEIEEEVAGIMKLTDDEVNDIHEGSKTKFSYRLAWSRTYLKRNGLIDNSTIGVWALTPKGQKTRSVDKDEITRVGKLYRTERRANTAPALIDEELELTWQDSVIEFLQNMPADRFERLCQRMLRELGFVNVEVTGRPGDGGIDGRGMLKLGSVLSFRVFFQSKRYKGSVGPGTVRDFRGAMEGRGDRGLLITTGNYSIEARREAQREGAKHIDLIDGNELAEKLKELGLGIKVKQVEEVTIDKDWFNNL